MEKFTGRKIKILRSDNGGEHFSNEFISFSREVGIKRELIVPYNPQNNGVSKRKNITIMEVSKTMIHDEYLPMFLWGEESKIVVYVQNKIPG